jgi:hypothetical protein
MITTCTENGAMLDPADTVTDAGTLNGARLARWIDMLKPPLGTGADKLTVHPADARDARVVPASQSCK